MSEDNVLFFVLAFVKFSKKSKARDCHLIMTPPYELPNYLIWRRLIYGLIEYNPWPASLVLWQGWQKCFNGTVKSMYITSTWYMHRTRYVNITSTCYCIYSTRCNKYWVIVTNTGYMCSTRYTVSRHSFLYVVVSSCLSYLYLLFSKESPCDHWISKLTGCDKIWRLLYTGISFVWRTVELYSSPKTTLKTYREL